MAAVEDLDYNSLPVFIALVEAGSFTAAAERLGCTKTRVSLQIRRLEERLGQTLFHRTTRQVQPTQAGEALYRRCRPLWSDLEAALGDLEEDRRALTGELRITAPEDYAMQALAPVVAAFGAEHPELQVELRGGDRITDMVREGIDVAIRLGWLRDSTLRSSLLGYFQQWLMASPDYLRRKGTPTSPAELSGHDWVAFMPLRSPLTWTFRKGEQQCRVQMQARLRTNATGVLREMLARGAGLSVMAQPSAEAEISAGRLVRVLADWQLPDGGIYAVYPPGRYIPARVRAFVDAFRASRQDTAARHQQHNQENPK
ncbi:LysR family transcriptional regulator [Alloalcanivorax dieselolei]|nr:LysR family transcriptional regulator [Alloalcanivorax dieselolei]